MEKIKNILVACSLAAIPAVAGAENVNVSVKPDTEISQSVQDNITVMGKVTDEQGNPLAGVSVVEKGTTNSTLTDADGNFTFQVGENATLLFSLAKYYHTYHS